MITVRRSEARRHIKSEAQDSWLSFDPENEGDAFGGGFHALEALNEEAPLSDMSLPPHSGGDAESVTYLREGVLTCEDEAGRLSRLEAGEFQRTSVGRKLRHRVISGSLLNPAHVFQSCFTPDGRDLEPGIEQKRFPLADRKGVLRLVASQDGRTGSLRLHQDLRMYSSVLLPGHHLVHELARGRAAWLHLIKGRVLLQNHFLGTGDAAGLENEWAVSFTAQVPSEILMFDLA